MKKFYRGNITNYKLVNGWTSPINSKSKVVSKQLELVSQMPQVLTLEQKVNIKSPVFNRKI
jgi:hypothetical protein